MLNRTQKIHSFAVAVLMWLGQVVSPVGAYEVIVVQHGGTLDGTITLAGAIPEPKGFNLITFPDPTYCGRISNGKGSALAPRLYRGRGGRAEERDCHARRC